MRRTIDVRGRAFDPGQIGARPYTNRQLQAMRDTPPRLPRHWGSGRAVHPRDAAIVRAREAACAAGDDDAGTLLAHLLAQVVASDPRLPSDVSLCLLLDFDRLRLRAAWAAVIEAGSVLFEGDAYSRAVWLVEPGCVLRSDGCAALTVETLQDRVA